MEQRPLDACRAAFCQPGVTFLPQQDRQMPGQVGRFDLPPGCVCTWVVWREQVLRPRGCRSRKGKGQTLEQVQRKPGASGGSSAFSVNHLNFLMAQTCVWGDWVGGEGGVQRLQMVPPGSEVSAPPRARGGGTEVPGHPGAEAYAAGGAWQDLRSGGLALAGLVAYLPPSVSQHRRPELPLAGSPRRVSHPALSLEVAQCWQL